MPLDNETNKHFRTTLDKYKQRLEDSFAKIDHRIALQQILRVYDFNNLQEGTIDIPTLSQQVWGLNQALLLFWNNDTRQAGLPLFRSEPIKAWGNFMLAACGRVRLIDHYLEQLERGLLKVHKSSDSYLELIPTHEGAGVEVLQAQELDSVYADRGQLAAEQKNLLDSRQDIISEMATLVRPSQDYFIGYDTTATIDDWYDRLAMTLAPTRLGWDCFPAQAKFGGLDFSAYLGCIETLMAFALKHIDFCDILCAKERTIDPMDIYAFPSFWHDAIRYASYALDCTEETASKLMEMTRVTQDTARQVYRPLPARRHLTTCFRAI